MSTDQDLVLSVPATAPSPTARPRLRTAVKAGGLLDGPLPPRREPQRDADGNPIPDLWV